MTIFKCIEALTRVGEVIPLVFEITWQAILNCGRLRLRRFSAREPAQEGCNLLLKILVNTLLGHDMQRRVRYADQHSDHFIAVHLIEKN
ncbi:hypothetical protein CEQ23_05445 [Burkholderia cepacia]|uniref:Uncharacterized protein n=1 Tax=Burkholderia cepacia TaxID=292 RepID=A0ABM6NZ00_BURCE|nr:hypothetical protein APZ15_34070 [Burkholderia cepacia ATCC 25416]ASE93015.1 hypothetical protein CEQ23_05445 [Burkholderia cepacia]ATF79962.1 hypothetical protein CO711_21330 [Burkholderia cepacia]